MCFKQTKAWVCQEISANIDIFLFISKRKALNDNTVYIILLCLVLSSGKWKFAAFPKDLIKINHSLRDFTRLQQWFLNSDNFMLNPCRLLLWTRTYGIQKFL